MYQGYFINLDRNEGRRQAITRHLEDIGAAGRYRRIAAVDGRAAAERFETTMAPGHLGLWLSQLKLLGANSGNHDHLHVVEDDAIFAANAVSSFDTVLEAADRQLGHWDLIFTDVLVTPKDLRFFLKLTQTMTSLGQTGGGALVDLESFPFACMSSFFINRRSVARYAELISETWKLGVHIDLFVRGLVEKGVLKAYLTVPFLTSVSRESLQSDIHGGQVDRSVAVLEAYRRMFFQDADLALLDAELDELTKDATYSPMSKAYLKAFAFCLSNEYVVH